MNPGPFQSRTSWKVLILFETINKMGTVGGLPDDVDEFLQKIKILTRRQELLSDVITNHNRDFPLTIREKRKYMNMYKLPATEAHAFNALDKWLRTETPRLYEETKQHTIDTLRNRHHNILARWF